MWTSRTIALFLSLLLLSESTAATVGNNGLKIAQQSAPTPSVPLRPEKQKLYQQGVHLVTEGRSLEKKGTREGYQQAIAKYQQALKIIQELGLRVEEATINQKIGVVYVTSGENQTALKYFNQFLNISRELKLPILEAAALTQIAQAYTRTGKPREALTHLKQAESIFRAEKRFDAVALVLISTAIIYTELGEIPQTLEPLNQALQIYCDTLKDLPQQAIVLNQIGFSYSQMGDPKTALKYYEQALEILQKREDLLPAKAETLRNIGSSYHQLGRHDEALDYLNQARKIEQAQGLLVAEGSTLQNIADIYTSRGDYQRALESHKQARILFQKGGNKGLESRSIVRIVSIYKNYLGDNQNALKFIDEALELDKNTGDEERYAGTINEQADIYASQGDYQQALEICNQALEIARSTKNKNLEARTLSNMASFYELLGDYDLSVKTYKQAHKRQQEFRGLELERSALKRSADLLNRQGWQPLPGTRTEANTILTLLKIVPDSKSLQVFDFDANYNWATSNALNQFRILHFATHGFVNDANPELSGIVLSLVDKQGQDIKGYLRLGDLFNLNYPADLIVLSACETGLGKEIQGEGLVGLTRGLMYAGGERLVVSLWQVDDKGTSVFMQEFYQQMWHSGKSASAALRATQLKMWHSEKWRNPNYWAAFTFLGEWQ